MAWHSALANAAVTAGWDSLTIDGAHSPEFRDGVNTLVQGYDPSVLPADATDVVIMAGSPRDTVDVLMQADQMALHEALRLAASGFALASRAVGSGAQVVAADASSHTFAGLGEIARPSGDGFRSTTTGDALAFYEKLPPLVGASATWAPEVFIWTAGDEPGVADLTGRRRVIQYGPYLLLSAGTWTVDVVFELAMHRAITELRFEWGILHDVDRISQRLTVSGRYSASMTHSWSEAGAVELRIWLDRSMFDGTLKVLSVTVSRTG